MSMRLALVLFAAAVGLVSGPSSLESAALAQPPLGWNDLVFVFFGCLVAFLFVLGIQAVAGNNGALRVGWSLFALAAVGITCSGISGLAVALWRGGIAPYCFLFLVMGIASALSLALVRVGFRGRFSNDA